jgi:succinate dehydrogenase hydrophobic anchor subunit
MAFLFAVTIHAMVGLRSILLDFDPSHAPSAGSTAGSGCWAQRRWFGGSSS